MSNCFVVLLKYWRIIKKEKGPALSRARKFKD
jgi:hypothetical protein